jgi:hypothetical protein
MRKLLIGSVLALLLAAWLSTPWLALRELREAARSNDLDKLTELVDFPALRESVRQGALERLTRSDDGRTGSKARALGAAVAGALLGPMVDAFITPETLAALLQGQRPAMHGLGGSTDQKKPLSVHSYYESPNRFVYSIRPGGEEGATEEPVEFVLHRDGMLGWKLAELRLP